MAQLRSDILCKRKREASESSERKYKRMHIAEPIQEHEIDDENYSEFTFNAFDISDTEELDDDINDSFENINSDNALNSERWVQMIENWIEMVNVEENQLDRRNDMNESDEEAYEFEIAGHNIHPADNKLAKWKLLDLFDNSLEAPVCIGSMINLN